MSDKIEIGKQWIAKAKNDLLNADNNLKAEEIPSDSISSLLFPCINY
jgi:hypothetical protein